tara:strand:- start:933 stop:2204 length:1272 start_codon:yes stop_codon:yes gene_type:complete
LAIKDSELNISQIEEIFNPSEIDEFGKPKPEYETAILGGYALKKLGQTGLAKLIDTHGFGDVSGSYKGDSKISQAFNNLLTAGGGKRRAMPLELMKSILADGNPVELKAMKTSLNLLEEHMSKLKSQGLRIPKHMNDFYLNLQKMEPERRMAQSIVQTSFNQPITFKHGGKFNAFSFPQDDLDIGKALKQKGYNLNQSFAEFDVSSDRGMIKRLRGGISRDPRISLVSRLLKENKQKEAATAAKKGWFILKGKPVKSGVPLELIKEGDNFVVKFVPHKWMNGKLHPYKEYVVGGHTQKLTFNERIGRGKGFHKLNTKMFDITTYRSAGETVSKAEGIGQKARVLFGGPLGKTLGIHQPVVTTAEYDYRAPGGGRKTGSVDIKPRKSRKFVRAAVHHLYGKDKKVPWKDLKKLLTFVATKGKRF